jgi:hypothetical protein
MSPIGTQMRSADRVRKCLLFGVDRTYRGPHETDALDPQRTCRRAPIFYAMLNQVGMLRCCWVPRGRNRYERKALSLSCADEVIE